MCSLRHRPAKDHRVGAISPRRRLWRAPSPGGRVTRVRSGAVILDSPALPVEDFERETGWLLKPEGACRGGVCIPLPPQGPTIELTALAEHLGMGVVHDDHHGLWALGPSTVSRRALE